MLITQEKQQVHAIPNVYTTLFAINGGLPEPGVRCEKELFNICSSNYQGVAINLGEHVTSNGVGRIESRSVKVLALQHDRQHERQQKK